MWVLESNPGPRQEQLVLAAAEPSLQLFLKQFKKKHLVTPSYALDISLRFPSLYTFYIRAELSRGPRCYGLRTWKYRLPLNAVCDESRSAGFTFLLLPPTTGGFSGQDADKMGISMSDIQCLLDKEGASELVIDVIVNTKNDRIFSEGILLGIALLEGGNTQNQVPPVVSSF